MATVANNNTQTRTDILREAKRLLSPVSQNQGDPAFRIIKLEKLLFGLSATEPNKETRRQLEYALTEARSHMLSSQLAPIYPIERSVAHLYSRLESLSKLHANERELRDLIREQEQCSNSLELFVEEQVKDNQLELPQVKMLAQRADLVRKKLNEIRFYLSKLDKSPLTTALLSNYREQQFSCPAHLSLTQRKQAFENIVDQLTHQPLKEILTNVFARSENHFWCYDPQTIEKTAQLLQTYLTTTEVDQQNHQQLLNYLNSHHAVVLPLTSADYQQLFNAEIVVNLSQQFDQAQTQLKQLTPKLTAIQTQLRDIEDATQSLIEFPSAAEAPESVLHHYESDVQPRLAQLNIVNDILATLSDRQQDVVNIQKLLQTTVDDETLKTKYMQHHINQIEIASALQQRKAINKALQQHEMAVQRLQAQADAIKTQLSALADVRQSITNSPSTTALTNENHDAFFEPPHSSEPTHDPHSNDVVNPNAAPTSSRMSTLLRYAQKIQNH